MDQGEWLQDEIGRWGVSLTDNQIEQFHLYYQLLVETNKVMNLTTITDEQEVYIKHFYDSLTVVREISMSSMQYVLDIGTGAGFPGIPLKIAFPHLKLVLMDSLNKRIGYLKEVGNRLNLQDVEYIHGRAETYGRDRRYREKFDLVTARAVAKLNVLAEYCLPFVKVGGYFVAWKGSSITEEIDLARGAMNRLGKASIDRCSLSLPKGMGERSLVIIKKQRSTPKRYPRNPGIPSRKPIT